METKSMQDALRRWKLAAMTLMVITAGALAVRARADLPFPERMRARTVEAHELVIRDSEGHVRARLAVRGEAAQLVIYDEQGKALASLPERPRMKELPLAMEPR